MKLHFRDQAELAAVLAAPEFQGRALHVLVLHDDACTPNICVCKPEYVVEELTTDTYLAGQKAQAAWRKGATS